MSKKINPAFEAYKTWYAKNRDRFKISWRKRFDEMAEWEYVGSDFRFDVVDHEDWSRINVEWTTRTGYHSSTITVGRGKHFACKGRDVMHELAMLQQTGRIDGMGHPSLGDALVVLCEFREELDQLTLSYTLDREGKLTHINVGNAGLLRVMHRLESEDNE